jgi:hypothetical protein
VWLASDLLNGFGSAGVSPVILWDYPRQKTTGGTPALLTSNAATLEMSFLCIDTNRRE